jgi:hypothetical protein
MTFLASLHAIKINAEGDSTITLKVPADQLLAIIPLVAQTEQLLKVSVETEPETVQTQFKG